MFFLSSTNLATLRFPSYAISFIKLCNKNFQFHKTCLSSLSTPPTFFQKTIRLPNQLIISLLKPKLTSLLRHWIDSVHQLLRLTSRGFPLNFMLWIHMEAKHRIIAGWEVELTSHLILWPFVKRYKPVGTKDVLEFVDVKNSGCRGMADSRSRKPQN